MVHSFLTRFFSLVNSVKNTKSNSAGPITATTKRNGTSVSLEAILENSSAESSPPSRATSPTQSIAVEDYHDSSQVVRITKITKINTDRDCASPAPSFYLENENNNNQCQSVEGDDGSEFWKNTRWSSAHNWSWCDSSRNKSRYSVTDILEDGECDEHSLADSERNCISSSKTFKPHGDNSNTVQRRRLWFLLVLGLVCVLISVVSLAALVIVNSSLSSSQSSNFNDGESTEINPVNEVPVTESTFSDFNELLSNQSNGDSSSSEYESHPHPTTAKPPTTSTEDISYDFDGENLSEVERKRKISRLSWNLINKKGRHQKIPSSSNKISGKIVQINRDMDDDEKELVLPPKMVYTSSDYHLRRNHVAASEDIGIGDIQTQTGSPYNSGSNNKKSCCKTQRYSQVIKREGCEPVTIVNRMCIGQCVSVWIPGLFASFPVCKPSRSVWRTVKLNCGSSGAGPKIQKVRVEKVKRCSCMQIDQNDRNATEDDER